MKNKIHFKIFPTTNVLPETWDHLACSNIFLSKKYLEVLEKSAPKNMSCHYIGLFVSEKLVGIALSQFLNLNQLQSFGERDKCMKTSVRNFIFKNFSSHVLFIGNNMLTGQNAFLFSEEVTYQAALQSLQKAALALKEIYKNQGFKVHVTSFKDFSEVEVSNFQDVPFLKYYKFSTQPNMVLQFKENWTTFDAYLLDLNKKYRDQYKRCRKKSEGITKQKMSLEAIIKDEDTLYDLYFHVAKNAPFNTFFLAKNHFRVLKELLQEDFLLYGYFSDDKLVGFSTLIKNGTSMDTYFLGYDDAIQKEKMLYLNMLYDMIGFSINQGFKELVFARTALEIKSSVGAKPIPMFGFIQHSNSVINKKIDVIFNYLEPKTEWKERNPFKE